MAIKLASSLLALNIPSNKILKTDANGNIVAAVDGTDYNTAAGQWISTTGGIFYSDDVRIGTYQSDVTPEARLHVYQFGATTPKVLIEDGYNGDASVEFKISTQSYMMGIDNSDSDKFVLAASTALGTTNVLEVSTAGNPAFQTDTLFNKQVYFKDNIFFDANGYSFRFDHDGSRDLYQVTHNGVTQMYLRAVGGDNLQWEDINQDPILKLTQERDAYFYGKVGIGTTAPTELLELERTGKIGFGAEGNYGVRTGYFDDGSGVHGFHIDTKHIGTWSDRRLVVRADTGRVGIGTDRPSYLLHTRGADNRLYLEAISGQVSLDLDGTQNHYRIISQPTTGRFDIYDQTNSAHRFTIHANGNLQFHSYGAGLLKTDANGNVSLDTNTYLTSLPTHNHDTRYYTKTQSDTKYLTKGDAFIPIAMTASNYEASAEEVVIGAAGSYKGLAFPNGAKDFEFEVSIKGNALANHQGIFWGATDLTSLIGAGLTGYKTTHQNTDNLHIRDIANNSAQMTINPGFAPDDGQYHRYRLVQYRNPDTSRAILKVYLDGNLIFDTTEGQFNNPPQVPTYFGFIVYTGDVNFAHWNVREITDSEDLIRTIGENVFQPLGDYLTSLPAHNHDARYYTETEMDEFFDGTTAKTGYNKTNWDTAYGWGNHASAGYTKTNGTTYSTSYSGDMNTLTGFRLIRSVAGDNRAFGSHHNVIQIPNTSTTSYEGQIAITTSATSELAFRGSSNGVWSDWAYAASKTYVTGEVSAVQDNLDAVANGLGSAAAADAGDFATAAQGTNADTAFGWGNHASEGYLTSYTESDTLASVTGRGASTSNQITVGGITVSATFPYLDFVDTNSFTDPADRFRIRAGGNNGTVQWYDASAGGAKNMVIFNQNGNVVIGDTYVTPGTSTWTTSNSQFILGGTHNSDFNTGTKAKLVISGYDNDGSTIYPIVVEDENGLKDFWIRNRASASSLPTMFFAGNVGIGTGSPTKKLHVAGEGIFTSYVNVEASTGIRSDGWVHLNRYATNLNVSVGNNGSNVNLLVPNGGATIAGTTALDGTVNLNGAVNFNGVNGQNFTVNTDSARIIWDYQRNGTRRMSFYHEADQETFNFLFQSGNNLQINGNRILTTADEGSGNGIDADTVDGLQASFFLRSDTSDSFAGQLTNASINETPAYNKGAINLQPSVSGGSTGITFRSRVNSTSDAGYIWWYDDNDHYNELNSTENGVLLIAVQNDGGATSEDAIAIESSGDIYLNAGVASGAIGSGVFNAARGNVYLGYAADRARVLTTDDSSSFDPAGAASDVQAALTPQIAGAQTTADNAAAAAATAQSAANAAQSTANDAAATAGVAKAQAADAQTTADAALPKAGGTMTGTLRLPKLWSSSSLSTNSFYVQDSSDGFAFGIGTDISSWFSWDSVAGQKRAIDVWNNGSKILLGAGGHDTEIQNDLYVPNHIFHTGDTDTYMQFHAANEWRVVTGGAERLEVNNTNTTVVNKLIASNHIQFGGSNQGYTTSGGTYGAELRKIKKITLTSGNSNWDGDNHSITSRNIAGADTDSISINSYNDITLRLDSNDNNATSHFYITDNTLTGTSSMMLDMNTASNETLIRTSVVPYTDRQVDLGRDSNRWRIVFCEILDSAGQHEKNLQNPEGERQIGEYETGTVLVWKGGKNVPCTEPADHMRMGIAVKGQNSPLIQGAEPVLCTGEVNEGDYLVTSSVKGHAAAISPQYMRQHNLFDCVLGKALEGGNGDSHIIKTWVNI